MKIKKKKKETSSTVEDCICYFTLILLFKIQVKFYICIFLECKSVSLLSVIKNKFLKHLQLFFRTLFTNASF